MSLDRQTIFAEEFGRRANQELAEPLCIERAVNTSSTMSADENFPALGERDAESGGEDALEIERIGGNHGGRFTRAAAAQFAQLLDRFGQCELLS